MNIPFKYLAIEGNIGAGKSTLASRIAEVSNSFFLPERFEENPYLKHFYRDKEQFALDTELFFLTDRAQQISLALKNPGQPVVADFTIYKTWAFAHATLKGIQLEQFKDRFHQITETLPKPDLIIYLSSSTSKNLEQIKSRGRLYEQQIEAEYLESLERGYQTLWENQKDLSILLLEPELLEFPYSDETIVRFINSVGNAEFKGIKTIPWR